MHDIPIHLRPATPDDHALIFRSWLKSYKVGGDWPRLTRGEDYFPRWKAVVAHLLDSATTLVAVDPEEPDSIFGFLCFDQRANTPPRLHYAYVLREWRRMHVFRRLMDAAGLVRDGVVATHWTYDLGSLRAAGWNLRYLPLGIMEAA